MSWILLLDLMKALKTLSMFVKTCCIVKSQEARYMHMIDDFIYKNRAQTILKLNIHSILERNNTYVNILDFVLIKSNPRC